MFDMLPNQWTPTVPLIELAGDGPFRIEIAGDAVVAFRGPNGQIATLIDRCPHRSARLSNGTVQPDGLLRCPYHGWRFNDRGDCKQVPLNDLGEEQRQRLCVTRVPSIELAGCLWIYTGLNTDTPPHLPASLDGDPTQFHVATETWQTHWTRAVENFIDFSHLAYVHEKTIGGFMHHGAENDAVVSSRIDATDWGFINTHSFSEGPGFRLDWYRPNRTTLHFGPTDESKLNIFSVPISDELTRVMTCRKLPEGAELSEWQKAHEAAGNPVLGEDRMIVEAQTGAIRTDGSEVSVPTDGPTVAFRRWYREAVLDAA